MHIYAEKMYEKTKKETNVRKRNKVLLSFVNNFKNCGEGTMMNVIEKMISVLFV